MSPSEDALAQAFAALGHPTRLRVVVFLRERGEEGARVGQIQQALGVPASTLSHHLDALNAVELLRRTRQERFIYCALNRPLLEALAQHLTGRGPAIS